MIRPIVCLSLVACALAAAPCGADDMKAAIAARTAAWEQAFNAGDAAAVAALYSSDGMLLPPNGKVVTGRAAIEKFWRGFMGDETVSLESREIDPAGDGTAYEVGTFTVTDTGGKAVDSGKYLVIWRRDGKDWFMRRDIWNSDLAPQAETPSTSGP